MRNLTIKREKSFVACLATMKVYIEDHCSGEITINDVPCRKLGILKNGKEATFQIEDNSAKIFVIADKLSRNYCNEYYELPAGTEDVILTGKNRYNPAAGNAFRFDNNDKPEVISSRKKNNRKGIIILIVALVLGFIIGFLGSRLNSKSPKTFSYDGMEITLTNEFEETKYEDYNVCYDSEDIAVLVIKEEFAEFDGMEELSLREYGDALLYANSDIADGIELKGESGLVYFEYTAETDDTYYYYSVIFKTDDAFWTIQFATLEENKSKYKDTFIEWAKDIEFKE